MRNHFESCPCVSVLPKDYGAHLEKERAVRELPIFKEMGKREIGGN